MGERIVLDPQRVQVMYERFTAKYDQFFKVSLSEFTDLLECVPDNVTKAEYERLWAGANDEVLLEGICQIAEQVLMAVAMAQVIEALLAATGVDKAHLN